LTNDLGHGGLIMTTLLDLITNTPSREQSGNLKPLIKFLGRIRAINLWANIIDIDEDGKTPNKLLKNIDAILEKIDVNDSRLTALSSPINYETWTDDVMCDAAADILSKLNNQEMPHLKKDLMTVWMQYQSNWDREMQYQSNLNTAAKWKKAAIGLGVIFVGLATAAIVIASGGGLAPLAIAAAAAISPLGIAAFAAAGLGLISGIASYFKGKAAQRDAAGFEAPTNPDKVKDMSGNVAITEQPQTKTSEAEFPGNVATTESKQVIEGGSSSPTHGK
jgi:hypothetical protein